MLILIVFSISGKVIQSFAKAKCLANMRGLHVAFSSYVQDKGMWPQLPEPKNGQEHLSDFAWMTMLDSYGASRKLWICPILERGRLKHANGEDIKMHYIPTRFDANRISPHRWSKQPWLIEMGDAHGSGALILFPDGSIKGMTQVLNGG